MIVFSYFSNPVGFTEEPYENQRKWKGKNEPACQGRKDAGRSGESGTVR